MKSKLLIILLSLFYLPAISQITKHNDCKLYFAEIGVKDFNLGSSYKSFINESKKKKRKFNKESVYGIDIVTFTKSIILLKEKKTVQYNLKFHSDVLMDYSFRIEAGNFRVAPYYYQKVLKLLEKNNKNSFINKGGYSFMKTTKECQKKFNLEQEEGQYYISGGIGYVSPIWEQQFKDYMKDTGQER
ncbi:hypothetical protein [Flavobacterium ginsengiterrae]|uniref:GLPGLI family protein n=1 Tax=Flavobacterium ginsengiterrae TaxID=871695 RepID=A0ABP7H4G6_9FLAO